MLLFSSACLDEWSAETQVQTLAQFDVFCVGHITQLLKYYNSLTLFANVATV